MHARTGMQLASRQMTSSQDRRHASGMCAVRREQPACHCTAECDGRRCLLANSGGIPRHAPRQKRAPRPGLTMPCTRTYVRAPVCPAQQEPGRRMMSSSSSHQPHAEPLNLLEQANHNCSHTMDGQYCMLIGWVPIFSTCIKDRSMPPNYS